jgi:ABC-type uncharacterized transport system ATPase subunit
MTTTAGVDGSPVLSLTGLTKRYGDIVAVDTLSLTLRRGEVVALLGENGAGKSTVVNMVSGMTRPDAGTVAIKGHPTVLPTARAALQAGIGVVHQHYALVGSFTVAESFALGEDAGWIDRAALASRVRAIAEDVGISVDPNAVIGSLDVAGQQRVEILKALARDIDILVLDEPTAVLTTEDAERLFAIVRRLRDRGVCVLLITHRLSDVTAICSRAAVMHRGRLVADRPVAEVTPDELVSLMISGTPDSAAPAALKRTATGEIPVTAKRLGATAPAATLMSVTDVTLRRPNGSLAVEGVRFDLRAGEILSVAGVDGNGQAELVRCMAGLDRPFAGDISMEALTSSDVGLWTPGQLRKLGVVHIPDDRRRHAIASDLGLVDNFLLSHLPIGRYLRRGLVDRLQARADTEDAIAEFSIRTTGPDQAIGRLSGGNQQKLVLARELAEKPRVILAAHPSRGLDIRTIAFVQDRLRAERDRGAAILLVSAEMSEIMGLSDRVIVFAARKARGPVAIAETSEAEVGSWMAGH